MRLLLGSTGPGHQLFRNALRRSPSAPPTSVLALDEGEQVRIDHLAVLSSDKGEQVRVDLILVGCGQAVRRAWIVNFLGAFDEPGRFLR
jgi:hypothetical protein